jgi:hypothetical protein
MQTSSRLALRAYRNPLQIPSGLCAANTIHDWYALKQGVVGYLRHGCFPTASGPQLPKLRASRPRMLAGTEASTD